MTKIFYYECRRLLGNKFTVGLLAIIGVYSYLVMQEEVVFGISHTAPFSPWSFGVYLARLQPLLLVSLLFFVSFLSSKQAQAIKPLLEAACLKPVHYRLIRCGAIAAAFLLLSLVPVAYALYFYGRVFHFTAFHTLLAPLVFVLLPTFLLVLGLGLSGGQIHPMLVFALMPLILLVSILPLPGWLDFYGSSFLTAYPAALEGLDPPFQIATGQLIIKGLGIIAGILLSAAAILRQEKRRP